ncbi:MAG: hypothetical protein G01um101438_676 [Parcubacteria group bacterium Gr01-1014_38]|nr:MAG: hypothetical protein G01um101438_676 [Parcubacteria group bacterium Gr01-1014_38]
MNAKVLKTVRGTIKKAIYYLGSLAPYELTEELLYPPRTDLSRVGTTFPALASLLKVGETIRKTDDLIDEVLLKKNPIPVRKIKETIGQLRKSARHFGEIADLFDAELELQTKELKQGAAAERIRDLIEIRPSDYFLLTKILLREYPSALARSDRRHAWVFFSQFQRLRDLLDDIMSIEEDLIKGAYNSIVIGKRYGLRPDFFEDVVEGKFEALEDALVRIREHPYRQLLRYTIRFWRDEYQILFRPLLQNDFVDLGEFKKIYFMFKQI